MEFQSRVINSIPGRPIFRRHFRRIKNNQTKIAGHVSITQNYGKMITESREIASSKIDDEPDLFYSRSLACPMFFDASTEVLASTSYVFKKHIAVVSWLNEDCRTRQMTNSFGIQKNFRKSMKISFFLIHPKSPLRSRLKFRKIILKNLFFEKMIDSKTKFPIKLVNFQN